MLSRYMIFESVMLLSILLYVGIGFSLCMFFPPSDINECLSNKGGCQHLCVNEVGSFHCECNDGFNLDSNGLTCSGQYISIHAPTNKYSVL